MADGQTGSGKTYTMVGNGDDVHGIIPRAINQMFRTKENRESHLSFSMQASLFEIYNEEMRDLLAKGKPKRNGASELQETELDSQSQAEELIDSASTNRSVSYTAQNEQSSRSHMIFRLRVKCHNVDTGETLEGGLDLVDLAGSEKLKKSGSEGESKKEAEKIHTSLTALSRVLQSLANNESHIPYRDSKLTQELMPSLGGQSSKTLMMVNVSSDPQSSEETVSSLRLGERANGAVVDSTKRKTAQQQHQQQQSLTKRGR
jgi:kinesin family protein C1